MTRDELEAEQEDTTGIDRALAQSEIGRYRTRRGKVSKKHKRHVTPAMKAATKNPAFEKAFHKMQIENVPFRKLSPAEQQACNQYRRALGLSTL